MDTDSSPRQPDSIRILPLVQRGRPLDRKIFDAAWILPEFRKDLDDDVAADCAACLLAIRVAANAVLRGFRSEDLSSDIANVLRYIEALKPGADEHAQLGRLLDALVPFDPEAVRAELVITSRRLERYGLERPARALAELARAVYA